MILTLIKALDASSIADCLSQSVALNKQTQVRGQFDTCFIEKLSSKKVDSGYWSGILIQCLWSCITYASGKHVREMYTPLNPTFI